MEWLTVELAPILLGSKPATILSLANSKSSQLLTIWRKCGSELVANSMIRFLRMRQSETKEIILFYRTDILDQYLKDSQNKCFLEGLGYCVEAGVDRCLSLLQMRYRTYCPHEIGIFLGIPLKDVLGFMDKTDLPLTYKGAWYVYGDPNESRSIMEKFTADRFYISFLLTRGMYPDEILNGKIMGTHCA
ncbi:MAG: hypothetical protein H6Q69_408 [Firmicutes bacterium]|nr:hypothetical protein [Bacillota bacterium]